MTKVVLLAVLAAGVAAIGCDDYRDNTGTSGGNPPSSRDVDRAQAASDIKGPVANTSSHTAGSRRMTVSEGSENYNANNPYAAQTNGANVNSSSASGAAQQAVAGVAASGNGQQAATRPADVKTEPVNVGPGEGGARTVPEKNDPGGSAAIAVGGARVLMEACAPERRESASSIPGGAAEGRFEICSSA